MTDIEFTQEEIYLLKEMYLKAEIHVSPSDGYALYEMNDKLFNSLSRKYKIKKFKKSLKNVTRWNHVNDLPGVEELYDLLFITPMVKIPTRINDPEPVGVIARWRIKVGK